MYGDNSVKLYFLENFQKPPSGSSKPSGDSYHFNYISGFEGKLSGSFEGLPGGFWKFSRKCNFTELSPYMVSLAYFRINHQPKIIARNIITDSSSPNLVSLAYFGIVVSFPLITNDLPLTLSMQLLSSLNPHKTLNFRTPLPIQQ